MLIKIIVFRPQIGASYFKFSKFCTGTSEERPTGNKASITLNYCNRASDVTNNGAQLIFNEYSLEAKPKIKGEFCFHNGSV